MVGPKYTALAQSLPATVPFVGPETQERAMGAEFAARLGANENVFGPSPKAVAAMAAAAPECWMYGDPENHELKAELAAYHGIPAEAIVLGEGIDGLLGYLCRLCVSDGVNVVTSDGAYPTFNFHVAGYGGSLHKVPYKGDFEDPEALLKKATELGAGLIYFANPDNPMGTVQPADVVADMIARVPDGSLLVLDEAYGEFAPEGTMPPLDVAAQNVIRFRTFSKAYGMAGARIAYGIAHPELATAFNKIRNHFGLSRISVAGAREALADQAYLRQTVDNVGAARSRIEAIAAAHGMSIVPSATNFVAIDCGKDGAFAKAVLDGLIARGVFVRMPFVAPQNRCIRVSAGRPQDLDLFEQAFGAVLAELNG